MRIIVASSYLSYVSANLMGGGGRRASAQTAAAQMPQSQSSHLLLSRASLQVCRSSCCTLQVITEQYKCNAHTRLDQISSHSHSRVPVFCSLRIRSHSIFRCTVRRTVPFAQPEYFTYSLLYYSSYNINRVRVRYSGPDLSEADFFQLFCVCRRSEANRSDQISQRYCTSHLVPSRPVPSREDIHLHEMHANVLCCRRTLNILSRCTSSCTSGIPILHTSPLYVFSFSTKQVFLSSHCAASTAQQCTRTLECDYDMPASAPFAVRFVL